jgi:hypothetical protein
MKSSALLLPLLLLITTSINCKKQTNDGATTSPTQSLMGKWVWVKSSGGLRGGTTYNIPRNNNQTIEFTSTATFKDCVFTPTCFETPVQTTTDSIFYFNPSVQQPERKKYYFQSDTLFIQDGCCDRFLIGYLKL